MRIRCHERSNDTSKPCSWWVAVIRFVACNIKGSRAGLRRGQLAAQESERCPAIKGKYKANQWRSIYTYLSCGNSIKWSFQNCVRLSCTNMLWTPDLYRLSLFLLICSEGFTLLATKVALTLSLAWGDGFAWSGIFVQRPKHHYASNYYTVPYFMRVWINSN